MCCSCPDYYHTRCGELNHQPSGHNLRPEQALPFAPTASWQKKNTSAANWCSQSDMLEHVSFHSVTPAAQTAPDTEHGLCLETCLWSPGRAPSRQEVHINKQLPCTLSPVNLPDAVIHRGSVPIVEPQSLSGCGMSQCVFVGHLV